MINDYPNSYSSQPDPQYAAQRYRRSQPNRLRKLASAIERVQDHAAHLDSSNSSLLHASLDISSDRSSLAKLNSQVGNLAEQLNLLPSSIEEEVRIELPPIDFNKMESDLHVVVGLLSDGLLQLGFLGSWPKKVVGKQSISVNTTPGQAPQVTSVSEKAFDSTNQPLHQLDRYIRKVIRQMELAMKSRNTEHFTAAYTSLQELNNNVHSIPAGGRIGKVILNLQERTVDGLELLIPWMGKIEEKESTNPVNTVTPLSASMANPSIMAVAERIGKERAVRPKEGDICAMVSKETATDTRVIDSVRGLFPSFYRK